jgi:tetratricopeptide repeat protein
MSTFPQVLGQSLSGHGAPGIARWPAAMESLRHCWMAGQKGALMRFARITRRTVEPGLDRAGPQAHCHRGRQPGERREQSRGIAGGHVVSASAHPMPDAVADRVCRRSMPIDPPFGRFPVDLRPRRSKFGRSGRLYPTSTSRRHRSGMTGWELEAAADRGALAAILEARGRDREAWAVLVEVLGTLERVLGPEHYDVVGVLDRLASIADRRGDRAGAAELLTRSLTIKGRVLGTEHAEVQRTAAALARMRQECEDRSW